MPNQSNFRSITTKSTTFSKALYDQFQVNPLQNPNKVYKMFLSQFNSNLDNLIKTHKKSIGSDIDESPTRVRLTKQQEKYTQCNYEKIYQICHQKVQRQALARNSHILDTIQNYKNKYNNRMNPQIIEQAKEIQPIIKSERDNKLTIDKQGQNTTTTSKKEQPKFKISRPKERKSSTGIIGDKSHKNNEAINLNHSNSTQEKSPIKLKRFFIDTPQALIRTRKRNYSLHNPNLNFEISENSWEDFQQTDGTIQKQNSERSVNRVTTVNTCQDYVSTPFQTLEKYNSYLKNDISAHNRSIHGNKVKIHNVTQGKFAYQDPNDLISKILRKKPYCNVPVHNTINNGNNNSCFNANNGNMTSINKNPNQTQYNSMFKAGPAQHVKCQEQMKKKLESKLMSTFSNLAIKTLKTQGYRAKGKCRYKALYN